MVQDTSNANSDRKSNELVWKIVESIIWDWNVASVVLIRGVDKVIFVVWIWMVYVDWCWSLSYPERLISISKKPWEADELMTNYIQLRTNIIYSSEMRLVHDHMSNGPLGSKYVFHLEEGFINKNYFVAGNDFLMNKSIINHHLVTSVSFFFEFCHMHFHIDWWSYFNQ